VRFIQEAKGDQAKAELFAACRDGRVAVLVGSTEGMGVGTNVQRRAVELLHLDCPWRPADLAQREGRIVRQGNENAEVAIVRYVTERSFDAYTWQTVARKAESFNGLFGGRFEDVSEIEDLGDTVLSLNEAKALATGNPLLLEEAQAQAEATRLERLERAHDQARGVLQNRMRRNDAEIEQHAKTMTIVESAIASDTSRSDSDAAFCISIGTRTFDKRTDADERMREVICARVDSDKGPHGDSLMSTSEIGKLRGFVVTVKPHWPTRSATLSLEGVPGSETPLSASEIERAAITVRLENKINRLPQIKQQTLLDIKRLEAESERAKTEFGRPFRHTAELVAARTQLNELQEKVAESARARPAAEAAAVLEVDGAGGPHADGSKPESTPLAGLIARMEARYEKSVCSLPSDGRVAGTLALVEVGSDETARAVVVGAHAIYIVAGFGADEVSRHVGQSVELEKQGGLVRITARTPELRLGGGLEIER
jgi:hypothetical protein